LLGLMALIVLPFAVIFFAVLPLMEASERADAAARDNEATLTWVTEQVTKMPENAGADGGAEADSLTIGIAGIEDRLVSAGLRDQVVQLANRADGGVDLALEDTPFETLTAWLRSVEGDWGYQIAAFRLDAASPGLVNAVFELAVP
ncbi:MAG: type II secretion system protein GspM, partial [Pseudomonadota bacterium]